MIAIVRHPLRTANIAVLVGLAAVAMTPLGAAAGAGVPSLMVRLAATPKPSAAATRWAVRSLTSQALEAGRVMLDHEARERCKVELAVIVHLAVPRECALLLLRGECVGREVEAHAEELRVCLALSHGTTTARPAKPPSRNRR